MRPLLLLVAGFTAALAVAAPARAADCLPSQVQAAPCVVSQPPARWWSCPARPEGGTAAHAFTLRYVIIGTAHCAVLPVG